MYQSYPNDKKITLKESQDRTQAMPSTFSVDPEYFNSRIVRIKTKIDELMKDCIQTQVRDTKEVKTEFMSEDRNGSITARSYTQSYGRVKTLIPPQKLTAETKLKIKSIYNEIHALEVVAVRDENSIETNTFQLRSFLKDLRNQYKRIVRILPESVHFEIQNQKKQPFKKSMIKVGQNDTVLQLNEDQQQIQTFQTKEILQANQLIEQTLKRRKIFHQSQHYYSDQQNHKCNLFKCQLV